MKSKSVSGLIFLALLFVASCAVATGPRLGEKASGPMLDKSADAELAALKQQVMPLFRQHEFKGEGYTLQYSLFSPSKMEVGKKYPLLLFMADASTAGRDVTSPLEQGYGALLWATREAQEKNPCFVLVPQFSGVAVDDAYQHTPEIEGVLELVAKIVRENAIDPARLYTTGQSMGGMISMYYNIAHPGIFAASLFVDCHWDSANFNELVKHPFVLISAGDKGKSWICARAIEDACRAAGVSYTWAEWSARLPQTTQDELAATMLGKGQPVNLIGFENGTVLPESGQGSEHMYSFDHAYRLTPVREWLFKYSLPEPARF